MSNKEKSIAFALAIFYFAMAASTGATALLTNYAEPLYYGASGLSAMAVVGLIIEVLVRSAPSRRTKRRLRLVR